MLAESPKYPALYDIESEVRFRRGRAEVTEEQALLLAKRRYVDRILIDGTPAKDWAKAHRAAAVESPPEPVAEPTETVLDESRGRGARKAT